MVLRKINCEKIGKRSNRRMLWIECTLLLVIWHYSALLWKYLGLENTLCTVRSCFCGFKVVPVHSRELGPNPEWGSRARTKSRMRLQSRDQIQAQQPLENMIFVSFSLSCLNFLSLQLAIIAIKTRHWALVKIYSLAVGVCCKASALAASAFATNTYVSAINLHQGSTEDLNPYNKLHLYELQLLALIHIYTAGLHLKAWLLWNARNW